jgi:glycerol-3-phosphate dehydrogenase
MRRDPAALANTSYDVVVVGGGIYGICALHEAARRGLSACLVERGDFVGATSSNSLKTIHGGLRYLQHADLGRMRESIRERARLLRIAPHLVRPIAFVLPTRGFGLQGKPVMRAALLLNDLIGFDRSAGAIPGRHIPGGRVVGRAELGTLVPGLDTGRGEWTGGAVWYDCQVANTERLAFAYLHSAVDAGAACANYLEVTGLLRKDRQVLGVKVRDAVGDDSFEIRARAVVNAAGPWVDRLLRDVPAGANSTRFHLSKAFNLVTRRLYAGDHAVGFRVPAAFSDSDALLNKGDRLFFVVPWKQFSLIGTRHLPYRGDPDRFVVTDDDIELFLAEINAACPGVDLTRGDVLAVLGGMLPEAPREGTGEVQLVKHSRIHDHAADGAQGLYSIVGVKWTTARAAGETAIDAVETRLRPDGRATRVAEVRLHGGEIDDLDRFYRQEEAQRPATVSPAAMRHLLDDHGSAAHDVLAYVRRDPELGREVGEGLPVIAAEVVFAADHEMAVHLIDVVRRRTELAAGGHPGREALERCADLMGAHIGWSPERREAELDHADAALHGPADVPSS